MFFDDLDEEYTGSPGDNSWDTAEVSALRASRLYEDGQIQAALAAIDQALEVNPSNPAWHFNKALTLDALERFSEALQEYSQAAELCPDDIEILNCLAMDYTRVGQFDKAIETFEYIEKLAPDFEPSYCNRIITYTEMELHEKAEQMFYMAQQINENCPLCFYNIGNSCFIRGQYARAVWCWEKTAELEPTHPQINFRIAQGCWAAGELDKAHHYFLKELRTNPGDIETLFNFGIFLLQQGQTDSAKEKFNRILELEPNHPSATYYLGEIALSLGQRQNAVEFFNHAMKSSYSLPGPRYRLAQIALKEGNYDKTLELLHGELQFAPPDGRLLLSIGIMMMMINRLEYATHCLLRVTEIDPSNASAYANLAKIMAMKGEFQDACQFAEQAVKLAPADVSNYELAAEIYKRSGDKIAVLDILNEAVCAGLSNKSIKAMLRGVKFEIARQHIVDKFSELIHRFVIRRGI